MRDNGFGYKIMVPPKNPSRPKDNQCQLIQGNKKKCSKEIEDIFDYGEHKKWLCKAHRAKAIADKEYYEKQEKINLLKSVENAYEVDHVLTIGDVYMYQCKKCFSFIPSSTPPERIVNSEVWDRYVPIAPKELLGHIDYHYETELSLADRCRCCH